MTGSLTDLAPFLRDPHTRGAASQRWPCARHQV